VLAEYVLLKFDSAIREHEHVFFYSRFVDDIVLATNPAFTKSDVNALITKSLPPPLEVHTSGEKVASLSIGRISGTTARASEFDYLGYRFSVHGTLHPTRNVFSQKCRGVDIEISKGKIEKIKGRLIDSFISFICGSVTSASYTLLRNRVRALTGNYYISDPISGIQIKTGIYYNYCHKNIFNNCELRNLDAFLRGLLFSQSHKLSRRINKKLSKVQRMELIGYTFSNGFHEKRFHSLTYGELKEIKECWKK
jgi:hypothetical protein